MRTASTARRFTPATTGMSAMRPRGGGRLLASLLAFVLLAVTTAYLSHVHHGNHGADPGSGCELCLQMAGGGAAPHPLGFLAMPARVRGELPGPLPSPEPSRRFWRAHRSRAPPRSTVI